MPGKFFDPPRATMVAGDIVLFRNSDLVTHDVLISPFGSGPLARFTSWSQQIDQPGGYPFLCTLHAFMRGNLDVVAATLAAAPHGVLAGEPLTLSGRTRAGTAHVGIEQSLSSGAWSAVGAGAAPAPDGTFTTTVPAVEGASYRVTTPAGPSPAVTPRITARVNVHLHVERRGRHATVHVHTKPSVTGFTATLELYSRWHFRWRPQRHANSAGTDTPPSGCPRNRAASPASRCVAPAAGPRSCTAAWSSSRPAAPHATPTRTCPAVPARTEAPGTTATHASLRHPRAPAPPSWSRPCWPSGRAHSVLPHRDEPPPLRPTGPIPATYCATTPADPRHVTQARHAHPRCSRPRRVKAHQRRPPPRFLRTKPLVAAPCWPERTAHLHAVASVSHVEHQTTRMDDDHERRGRLPLLGKAAVLAHRLARPPAAEMDDDQQP